MANKGTDKIIESIRRRQNTTGEREHTNSLGSARVHSKLDEGSQGKKVFKKRVYGGVTSIATTRISRMG